MEQIRILFLCGQNTARSQIAQAYLELLGGEDFIAESAGLEAGAGVNPVAAEVRKEVGINISEKDVTAVMDLFLAGKSYDYVVAVCDAAKAGKCPDFPGVHSRLNWPFEDIGSLEGSWEEKVEQARFIRDQIGDAVKRMVEDIRDGKEPF
jgi:arsenate reductase